MAKNQAKGKNQPTNQYNSISELDTKQKSDIAVWLYEIYREYYVQNHAIPTEPDQHDALIRKLIQKVKQAKIRIPDKQIQLYYNSKQSPLLKRLKKEFPEIREKLWTARDGKPLVHLGAVDLDVVEVALRDSVAVEVDLS